jgi:hypothetical protein
MRKKSKRSGIEDQLRRKVAASLADPRKSIAASKIFKRLRAILLQPGQRHPEVLAASRGEPRRIGHRCMRLILRDAAQERGSSG